MKPSFSTPAMQIRAVLMIAAIVAARYSFTVEELQANDRHEEVVWPRHLTFLLAKQLLGANEVRISQAMMRNRSTICYGARSAQNLIDTYDWARDELENVLKECASKLRLALKRP